ncbi:aminotransferase yhxA [Robertmurraya korlensis]|uniref:aminotransferase yhxA n=1 Tax=Robertmurraya korlensis TaxID=519977 RepID=UPI00204102A9|nr:aminotransferase yhxA [Robertmurraya korlensis]MCM3602704.1 aminotransferase yhxA [Robertmurraya korlensis]
MSKTRRMMTGITSTALVLGMAGCSSATEEYTYTEDIPDPPEDTSCSDWEWDAEDGVWECDDYDSNYYGHYFYGGRYYKGKSALHASKDYLSYKNSSSFKGSTSSGTVKNSNGFGKGTTSSGG